MRALTMILSLLAAGGALAAAKPRPFAGLMYGKYAECEAEFDAAFAAAKEKGKPLAFRMAGKQGDRYDRERGLVPLRAGRDIKWVLGKHDELKALCDWAIATDPGMPAVDRLELRLSAFVAPLKGEPERIADEIAKTEPGLAGDLPIKERCIALRNCGRVANACGNEPLARGLQLYEKRLKPDPERRVYPVRYSRHAVTGPDSWSLLGFEPEKQTMDRPYGGRREFFHTDVATGDRGTVGEGTSKTLPDLSVVCDDWGVHFRFLDFDADAERIADGLVPGGSYEAYLAPGKNKPYFCMLARTDGRPLHVMNTLYDHAGHRRVDDADLSKAYSRTTFEKGCVATYVSFSWDIWGDQIPTDGFRWDFEVVRWGRAGAATWNGLKGVHSRYSWGELSFELPTEARVRILRRQIVRAKNDYLSEKVTTPAKTGVFDHWQDADLGDPAFYEVCLAPLVKELDGYTAQVTSEMTSDTILELEKTALQKWRDVRYTVSRLRADYLARTLPVK